MPLLATNPISDDEGSLDVDTTHGIRMGNERLPPDRNLLLFPRVVNANDTNRIITHNYLADGLSEEFLQERLIWDRMSRPLLDGGEGKPQNANA